MVEFNDWYGSGFFLVGTVTGKKQLYNDKESQFVPTYGETLPKKYHEQTELRLDVKPGRNEKNWELSTK
jgi:hypothetical protein